ncbi:hypothetical protein [Aliikangiella maris]|uniref:Uncharacterized protein n=2 Tax=Aliikangiella maris TaxID=3162458 RepID=A0ABV2C0A6_9GAMM
MLKVRTFWCIVIFGFVISSSACATEKCIFSEDTVSEKQYAKSNAIGVYQWFKKSNEIKGVLSNGNLFSVKHWSCNHYGKQAVMVVGPQMQSIPSELDDQVLHLGKIALSETEFKLLSDTIGKKSLSLSESPIKRRVTTNEFDEFYIQVTIVGEAVFIEIKLYKA